MNFPQASNITSIAIHRVYEKLKFALDIPCLAAFWVVATIAATAAVAQQPETANQGSKEGGIAVPVAKSVQSLPARELAEGVLTIIPPSQHAEDTALGPVNLDFVEKHPELEWSGPGFPKSEPNFASRSETLLEMSRDVTLRHPVRALEFAFKPLRTVEADVPQASGKMQRKLVWYLIYRVRYLGGDLDPKLVTDASGISVPDKPDAVFFSKPFRFLPRFTLEDTQASNVRDSQVLSTVIPKIAAKERVGKPILDNYQISRTEVPLSTVDRDNPIWGIATWTDIDPSADFLTVQVKGLTNAYRVKLDTTGKKIYLRKTLEMHFWRPGDSLSQAQDQVRLGVPAFLDANEQAYVLKQFGIEKRLDYQWVYR